MARIIQSNAPINSPDWWLLKLSKELSARQADIRVADNYYDGDHNLAFATPKFRETFGTTFASFSDNWCGLICDAVDERLDVEGFRYGDKPESDKKTWAIWQQNDLDAISQMAHLEALVKGESFASVWYNEKDTSKPVITIEDATQCIVHFVRGSQCERAAALKRWIDDDGYIYATVYLPDAIYKYRSGSTTPSPAATSIESITWQQRDIADEVWPLPNPLNVVPIVPLRNKPRVLKPGVSEIADIIPVQDAVNKLINDMLVASEFGAAPQRWATGIQVPKDPSTGMPIEVFSQMLDRVWLNSNPQGSFGQFTPLNIAVFVSSVEMLVQHLASRSRTPPHYFYLSGQFPSGDAIKSAETGLVKKARRRMRHFGESWEEVMRLAWLVAGDKGRSQEEQIETVWGDPETMSESMHMDALIKKRALHVPLQQLWQDAGYTPQQIERFMVQLTEEAQLGLIPDPLSATDATQKEVKDFQLASDMEPGLGGAIGAYRAAAETINGPPPSSANTPKRSKNPPPPQQPKQ